MPSPATPRPATPRPVGAVNAVYLRVSITNRCNLRCTYCLPENARFAQLDASVPELCELMSLVAAAVPVHKLRITGGEPTLEPRLVELTRHAASLTPQVALTSNGTRLAPHLPALREAGLQRLNISLDAADALGFERAARRPGFEAVLAAIRAARELGFQPLKVNCVATRATDVGAMLALAVQERFHLRFIELMQIGEAAARWQQEYVSSAELRARLAAQGSELQQRTDLDEPTSRVWTIPGVAATVSTVGFITTVSAPFCASCDRLRLTREGRLYSCLFDPSGVDVLGALRAGGPTAAIALIRSHVEAKAPPKTFRRLPVMASIGG